MDPSSLSFYSRFLPLAQGRGCLKHWYQHGTIVFLTYHLADSLAQSKLQEIRNRLYAFEKQHPRPWSEDVMREYKSIRSQKINYYLDQGYGSCILRNPIAANILNEKLLQHNGEWYQLVAYVIMSNHVHILMIPSDAMGWGKAMGAVKGVSANLINKYTHKQGQFWDRECFDTYIRDEAHFYNVMRYIYKNYYKQRGVMLKDFWREVGNPTPYIQ